MPQPGNTTAGPARSWTPRDETQDEGENFDLENVSGSDEDPPVPAHCDTTNPVAQVVHDPEARSSKKKEELEECRRRHLALF